MISEINLTGPIPDHRLSKWKWPRNLPKKLLELINESKKAIQHKANTKNIIFLHTSNEQLETKIWKIWSHL